MSSKAADDFEAEIERQTRNQRPKTRRERKIHKAAEFDKLQAIYKRPKINVEDEKERYKYIRSVVKSERKRRSKFSDLARANPIGHNSEPINIKKAPQLSLAELQKYAATATTNKDCNNPETATPGCFPSFGSWFSFRRTGRKGNGRKRRIAKHTKRVKKRH